MPGLVKDRFRPLGCSTICHDQSAGPLVEFNPMPNLFSAGASTIDWTPKRSVYLAGYPHVQRDSTGTHDPLLASAMCLSDGEQTTALAAVDVLFITHAMAGRIRARLEAELGLPPTHVLIAATHTHSGPKTTRYITDNGDPTIPAVDEQIVQQCEDAVVKAVREAHASMVEAEAAMVVADATGIGGNRRDPDGPTDPEAPLLVLRRASDQQPIAAMTVYGMHPTVLHEDSTLFSGDFPAYTRQYLQQHWLGEDTPVLYFTGVAGNQSPRHVTQANTFAEAQRLGEMLGERLLQAAKDLEWRAELPVSCQSSQLQLPARRLPELDEAERRLTASAERFESLRQQGAPRPKVRTAEVDWFGAQRTLNLTRAAAEGGMQAAIDMRSPTEIQLITVGPWTFIAWPGEVFVEFGLKVKARHANVQLITYANGENGGYLVTREAVDEGGYEATSALFQSPDGGDALVAATLEQLESISSKQAKQST
ncbi:neutral/alkaline non-lysosomal ceramidase N-terminal domain-containing protein [Phycisphaerales bacterium AB-hyl4]|uniref:Neutral/alkaline non-lysosomal ceramidase N-terminal domain-containing protein n=1 Tax=Natronomicrosphaera hydrolytica TaxID=3242702 RepID=A0ABV4U5H6_9BACT